VAFQEAPGKLAAIEDPQHRVLTQPQWIEVGRLDVGRVVVGGKGPTIEAQEEARARVGEEGHRAPRVDGEDPVFVGDPSPASR